MVAEVAGNGAGEAEREDLVDDNLHCLCCGGRRTRRGGSEGGGTGSEVACDDGRDRGEDLGGYGDRGFEGAPAGRNAAVEGSGIERVTAVLR